MIQKTMELEQVFDHIPKYQMKISVRRFKRTGREDIFKLTIGNESTLS